MQDSGEFREGEAPVLDRVERRVLGTLIEKALTTPESYPLTLKALHTGCNQKSNRDPVTAYSEEMVEEGLERLRARGLVSEVMATTGRTPRYRQDLAREWELRGVQLGVLAELLLRGAQAEGDLRARASRMRDIPGQEELREILAGLAERRPALVQRLSPAHVQRGVRWTHCLGPAEEREVEEAAAASPGHAPDRSTTAAVSEDRLRELERRIEELERRLSALEG